MTRLVGIASRLVVLGAYGALIALVLPAAGQQSTPASPADGHTVHVTALTWWPAKSWDRTIITAKCSRTNR